MPQPIEQPRKDFLVKISDVYKRIRLEDILFLKSEGKYVSLVLESRTYSYRGTLKELSLILPANFARVHLSFIINLDKVTAIKNNENLVVLADSHEVAYSRSYKEILLDKFIVG